ncbi:uncharacterized protein VP01_10536g2 [Puccinia sorghi]|uniref:Uncharacterized protein n=1 Tax=Puccinia sorghi TaxID=27349 RepID=A0A0L6VU68_9BASI|nr:uncharacterized protein VP01_10536g2 [Puccinia sorghi]
MDKIGLRKKVSAERRGHLKKEDYLVIIKWLKIKPNYNSCFGTGKAPDVGSPAKGKINDFKMISINP